MSDSSQRAGSAPQAALDAALSGKSGDPLRRAMWLDALDRRLRPLLPTPLAAHCRLANVREKQLVFLVDAPVWRAKLRLHEADVLDAARSLGLDCTTVAIKSSATPLPAAPTGAATTTVSATARQALRVALASLQDPDSPESAPGHATGPGGAPRR